MEKFVGKFSEFGVKICLILAFILQSVSKKTTHRLTVAKRLNLWFFLPLLPRKIQIFWGYDIMILSRGTHTQTTHEPPKIFKSVLGSCYNDNVERDTPIDNPPQIFKRIWRCGIMNMSRGHRNGDRPPALNGKLCPWHSDTYKENWGNCQ